MNIFGLTLFNQQLIYWFMFSGVATYTQKRRCVHTWYWQQQQNQDLP